MLISVFELKFYTVIYFYRDVLHVK